MAERGLSWMRPYAALTVLLGCLTLVSAAWAANPTAPAGEGLAEIRPACAAPTPGHATCFALIRTPVASGTPASATASPYVLDSGASSPGPAGGLTPEQLASAYGYEPAAGGAGQTVGIVDAYDDPEIENDLATFDAHYELPGCTRANGCLKKVNQSGSTSPLPPKDESGWSVEISLDVETVHAVCPNCRILLVEADDNGDANLATAVNEAVALGATEISNGYGGPEDLPEPGLFERDAYDHPGVPIVAAAGDTGYYGWTYVNDLERGPEMPEAPASLPSVVAVGGTSLALNADGTRASETVWNDNGPLDEIGKLNPGLGATGGGCSRLFSAEPWQTGVSGFAATGCGTKRLDADVSAVGDPLTGFDLYDSYKCGPACEFTRVKGGWATFGGTSLSTPIIAALYGLAGGTAGMRYPALTLYGHVADSSARFDVTSGGNSICGGVSSCGDPNAAFGSLVDCNGTTACNAAPGFDGPSGVGTPKGLALFKPLLPTAVITPPGAPTAGSPAVFSAGASSDPYPGGSFSSYTWNWGDGSAGSGVSPLHSYGAAGTYTVTLTVTDNYGLTSSSSTSVSVGAARPVSGSSAGVAPPAPSAEVADYEASIAVPVPDAKLASTAFQASASGAVTIEVSCPTGEVSCSGTVTLHTLDAVSARAGSAAKSRKAILTLASGSFTVAGGRVKTVTLHLSAKARSLLSRSHVLRVRATIVAHNPAGATHTTQAVVTLRAPKAKHGKG